MNTNFLNHDRYINAYRPSILSHHGASIGDFVKAAAREVGAPSHELMRRRLIYITKLVLWCWQSCGLPLERESVFTASIVEEFITVQARTQAGSTVARQRTLLLAIVKELNAGAPPSTVAGVDRDQGLAPYDTRELAMLRSWAAGQSNTRRRHNASVILALMAGAGVRPIEVRTVRRGGIEDTNQGLTVHLGSRSVPVLVEWEEHLREAVENTTDDEFLFQTNANREAPRLLTSFLHDSRGLEITPLPQRLRATWIVTQLQARVPLTVLLDSAGLGCLKTLTPYLGFVDVDLSSAREELRNAGGVR